MSKQLEFNFRDKKPEDVPFQRVTVTHQVGKILGRRVEKYRPELMDDLVPRPLDAAPMRIVQQVPNGHEWQFKWIYDKKSSNRQDHSMHRLVPEYKVETEREEWPGLGICKIQYPPSSKWAQKHFQVDPSLVPAEPREADWAYTRFRRFELDQPMEGIITGWQRRMEGSPWNDGTEGGSGLNGTIRSLRFYEVVLKPRPSMATRMILCSDDDIKVIGKFESFG